MSKSRMSYFDHASGDYFVESFAERSKLLRNMSVEYKVGIKKAILLSIV